MAEKKQVGSQLSVFLHYIWPILLTWLQGLINPTPAPAVAECPCPGPCPPDKKLRAYMEPPASKEAQLNWLLALLQTWLASMLQTVDWKRAELTYELEAIDYVINTLVPSLTLPAGIGSVLLVGLNALRTQIQAALDALPAA